jgi:hypothetical protein
MGGENDQAGRDDQETGETPRRGHGPVFIEKATAVCLTSQLAVTTTELAIIAGSKPASQPVLQASRKVRR